MMTRLAGGAVLLAAGALAAVPAAAQSGSDVARAWREAREAELLGDFAELLTYPYRQPVVRDRSVRGAADHAEGGIVREMDAPGTVTGRRGGPMSSLDRRSFLAALPGATVVAGGLSGLGRGSGADGGEPGTSGPGHGDGSATRARGPDPMDGPARNMSPRPPDAIGVQLYTVRSAMATDPDGTLAAIAGIGYREVELAGLYGMTAREMKARLDAVGLAATSSHQSVQEVRGSWEATLEAAVALGQSLIVVPSIPVAERGGEALARVADDFNRAGEAARAAGLRFGYHNHDWEMRPGADGVRPMDLLLDRTDPALVDWQMDIFWTVHGGADPMAELDARAGRVRSVHVKDRTAAGEMVDVGAGVIDFRTVLARAGELGLLHQFVEHDQPGDAIASVRASYRALAAMVPAGAGGDPLPGSPIDPQPE